MNKDHIRSSMLSLTEDALKHAKQRYADYLESAKIVGNEPIESGDAATAEHASDLAEAFDQPIHANTDKLARLESIDFSDKNEVEEGAVVKLNGRYFVIAVATAKFECDGESLMGISVDAPIYKRMSGLKVGDEFILNSNSFHIDQVL